MHKDRLDNRSSFLLAILLVGCNSPVGNRHVDADPPAQPGSIPSETGPVLRARTKAAIIESINRFNAGQPSMGLDDLARADNELATAVRNGLVRDMAWEVRNIPFSDAKITLKKYPSGETSATGSHSVLDWVGILGGDGTEIALIENSSPAEGEGSYELLVMRGKDGTIYVVSIPIIESAISASMAGAPPLDARLAAESVLSVITGGFFKIHSYR